ncbi:MAG TPA: methyl-accepting chemotaxis protein [Micromonospora sp.]
MALFKNGTRRASGNGSRREAEFSSAVADELEPLKALVDAVPLTIYATTTSGEVVWANAAGRTALERTPATDVELARRVVQEYHASGRRDPHHVTTTDTSGKDVTFTVAPAFAADGHLYGYVVTVKDMSTIVATAEMVSSRISASVEQLAEVGDALAQASEQTTDRATVAASSTEQLRNSIVEIARNSSRAAETANKAVEALRESAEALRELVSASEEIGNFARLINSVAEQTKLLALNATIEAARAGEAGRGFSIVAAEVKELANTTSANSEDITNRISALEAGTRTTEAALERLGELIGEVNEAQVSVAAAMEQQTAAAGEIARAVSDISQSAMETTERVRMLRESAAELRAGVQDLATLRGGTVSAAS